MRFKEWDNYLDSMLRHVKFQPDRGKIRQEFGEHMNDMFDDYISLGMSEEEAKDTVIDNLGNPDEVGKLMNKAHNAVIGWIWQIMRAALVVTLILCITPVCSVITNFAVCIPNLISGYHVEVDEEEILWTVDIGETVIIDSHTLHFDKLLMHSDGIMELRYRNVTDLLNSAIDDNFDVRFTMISNENGDSPTDLDGWSNGGYIDYTSLYIKGLPADSKKLIIEYDGSKDFYRGRYFRVEINLPVHRG